MFALLLRTRIFSVCFLTCIATALPAVAFAAAPTVSSFTPADNATDVPVSTSTLSITFNQVVQGSGGTISLKRSSDNSLIEAISVPDAQVTGSGTDTVSIALTAPINEYNTGFYVQIDSGTFRNGVGEVYAGIADTTTWNFTTEDVDSPIGGGSGRNYRRKLQALRRATSGSSGDLGIVELHSTAEEDTLSDSGELLESQVPDDEDDSEELSEDETEDETKDETDEEDRSPTEPDKPSISVYKVEYKFKRRVCKRVASNFRLDEVMMERVNKRLHARFRFTCSHQGLPL